MRAGATRAVNPRLIGRRRMASFALHADVAEFLDGVIRSEEVDREFEQVRVASGSAFQGRRLADIDLFREMSVPVLAVRQPHRWFPHQPAPVHGRRAGHAILLGADQIAHARRYGTLGLSSSTGPRRWENRHTRPQSPCPTPPTPRPVTLRFLAAPRMPVGRVRSRRPGPRVDRQGRLCRSGRVERHVRRHGLRGQRPVHPTRRGRRARRGDRPGRAHRAHVDAHHRRRRLGQPHTRSSSQRPGA